MGRRFSAARRTAAILTALLVVTAGCSADNPVAAPDPLSIRPERPVSSVVDLDPDLPARDPASLATDQDPRVFFVDPINGDDGHDGQNSKRAWGSLQYALDQLGPGDTLYLMGGNYRDHVKAGQSHFFLQNSGTPDAWIRVLAAPGQSPTIVANAGNGMEVAGNYIEVSGLQILGESFGVDNHYGWGLLTRNNHHVRFIGNEIAGMADGGITSVEATNLAFIDNTVHDNSFWGPDQGSGISLWRSRDAGTEPAADGYHDRIIGNTIYRNENKVFSEALDYDTITDGNGIIIDHSKDFGYSGRMLIANNVVFDNGGRGILVLESNRVDVVHNTTYQNARTPILEGGPTELAVGGSSDVQLLDNLAWSRPGAPAVIVKNGHNVISGGNVLVTGNKGTPRTAADLVVSSDPGLVSPTTDPNLADFRFRPDSEMAGRALPTDPAVALDADGTERPSKGSNAGAYGHVGETAPPG